MKNKSWSKLGISIAAALAPAAALGVTAGIIVSSLPKDEGGGEIKTDWDGFMKQYKVFYETYLSNTEKNIRYSDDDITSGDLSGSYSKKGQTGNLQKIEYNEQSENKLAIGYVGTDYDASLSFDTPEHFEIELKPMAAYFDVQSYIVCDEYIKLDWTSTTIPEAYVHTRYNKYGYIEYEENSLGQNPEVLKITYKKPPHQL